VHVNLYQCESISTSVNELTCAGGPASTISDKFAPARARARARARVQVLRPISVAEILEPVSGMGRSLSAWRAPTWNRGTSHKISWRMNRGKVRVRPRDTHTHTHTHTLSLSLSLSHTHTHAHTHTHTPTHVCVCVCVAEMNMQMLMRVQE